jgi:subtilase family serine protease
MKMRKTLRATRLQKTASGQWKACSNLRTLAAIALGCSLFAGNARAQTAARIVTPVKSSQMSRLSGTVSPRVATSKDLGPLPEGTPIYGMSIVFGLSPAQQKDLAQLLKEQQTKGSPLYHQWLKPGEFAARYGVNPSDLSKVAAWLQAQGFSGITVPPDADRITFNGTAAQVNAAFRTQLHRYLWHGQANWANASEVSVPTAFAGMTLGIAHLNTFRPRPHIALRPVHARVQNAAGSLTPRYTVYDQNNNEINLIAPADSAVIYDINALYNHSITGNGQTLGIVGQTDITANISDVAHFRSLSGLNPSNVPTQILVPNTGTAQQYAGDLEEADIDVEWSGAIAQNAQIIYVTVGNNQNYGVFDSLQYAIQTPLMSNNTKYLPVISISYGACEQAFSGTSQIAMMERILEQANAQGQTIIASAGDSGSADCDTGYNSQNQVVAASGGLAVDYPGSSQYVTSAGGTSFSGDINDQSKYWSTTNTSSNGSALSYIPETTWNDTPDLAGLNASGGLSAGGGGASTLFSKPAWQTGSGVPNDGHRDVPDVSLSADPAHDGYVLCTTETDSNGNLTGTSSCVYPVGSGEVPYFDANGSGNVYGGTSIVAPQLAGMVTLWNQQAGNTGGVGNINPILYLEAQENASAFHDVTTGSNAVVCQQGSPDCVADPNESGNYIESCCNAGPGYDEATGLGSVDAGAMAAVWPNTPAVNASFSLLPQTNTLTIPASGSGQVTLVLSPSNGFSGTVALTCSGLPSGASCSFSPGSSVNLTSGTAQNVSMTVTAGSSASLALPGPLGERWPAEAALAGVFGLSLLGLRRRKVIPRGWMAVLLLVLGIAAAGTLTACGSGSPSTGGGGGGGGGGGSSSSTVTVTGTSGATTASATIKVTIS